MKNISKPIILETERKVNNKTKSEIKIMDFSPYQNNHYVLRLKIDNLTDDNYKLTLNKGQLILLLFEPVGFSKPIHSHNFDLSELAGMSFDEQINTYVFTLPDKNYFLVSHTAVPYNNILLVTLGKVHHN